MLYIYLCIFIYLYKYKYCMNIRKSPYECYVYKFRFSYEIIGI